MWEVPHESLAENWDAPVQGKTTRGFPERGCYRAENKTEVQQVREFRVSTVYPPQCPLNNLKFLHMQKNKKQQQQKKPQRNVARSKNDKE